MTTAHMTVPLPSDVAKAAVLQAAAIIYAAHQTPHTCDRIEVMDAAVEMAARAWHKVAHLQV